MLTNAERISAIRFARGANDMIYAAKKYQLSDEEVAFLLSVDVAIVRNIGHYEGNIDGRTVEAMADRLTSISAHDCMRLAGFRAKTVQKPGTFCLASGDALP